MIKTIDKQTELLLRKLDEDKERYFAMEEEEYFAQYILKNCIGAKENFKVLEEI